MESKCAQQSWKARQVNGVASECLNLKWLIFPDEGGAGMEPEHKMAAATCLETKKMGEGGRRLRHHFITVFDPLNGNKPQKEGAFSLSEWPQ